MNDDKFTIQESLIDNKSFIFLRGIIDEDTDFSPLEKYSGPLNLNLSGITSINSLGIRAWVNFWKTMANKEVFYWECPPLIVRQMNMIPSFSGAAKVQSVFVPYICDDCEAEELKLLPCGDAAWRLSDVPETLPCTKCLNGEMEADGGLKQYFSFKR